MSTTLEALKKKWITDYIPTEFDYHELFDFMATNPQVTASSVAYLETAYDPSGRALPQDIQKLISENQGKIIIVKSTLETIVDEKSRYFIYLSGESRLAQMFEEVPSLDFSKLIVKDDDSPKSINKYWVGGSDEYDKLTKVDSTLYLVQPNETFSKIDGSINVRDSSNSSGVFFNSDGTKIVIHNGVHNTVRIYNLRNPYDIMSMIDGGEQVLYIMNYITFPRGTRGIRIGAGLTMSNDGRHIYLTVRHYDRSISNYRNEIRHIELTTPYDLSTKTLVNDTLTTNDGSLSKGIISLSISDDGTKLAYVDDTQDASGGYISVINLPTPYSLTGATFETANKISVLNPASVCISNNGKNILYYEGGNLLEKEFENSYDFTKITSQNKVGVAEFTKGYENLQFNFNADSYFTPDGKYWFTFTRLNKLIKFKTAKPYSAIVRSYKLDEYNGFLGDKPFPSRLSKDEVNKLIEDKLSYNNLSDKPVLFDGNYNNLQNKPTLFSGDYNDLRNKPTAPSSGSASTWEKKPLTITMAGYTFNQSAYYYVKDDIFYYTIKLNSITKARGSGLSFSFYLDFPSEFTLNDGLGTEFQEVGFHKVDEFKGWTGVKPWEVTASLVTLRGIAFLFKKEDSFIQQTAISNGSITMQGFVPIIKIT